MAEVFSNNYAFPSDAVPSAEQVHDALQSEFALTLELIKHDRGDHGAPRAYACIRETNLDFWVYWEPDRPEIEISAPGPMERMIQVNAAMGACAGRPIHDEQYWRVRRRVRTLALIRKIIGCVFAVSVAAVIIAYLHWWGVVVVVAIIAAIVVFYIVLLSRTFGRR